MGTTRYDVPTGCAWQGGQCRATGYNQTTLTCTSGCLTTSVACGVVNGQCQLVPHDVTCCTNLPTPTPPPPPTLTLEFQCATWGLGGWCRSNGALQATGVDPSGGQVTVNGTLGDPAQTAIHCQGAPSCTTTVPLPEGRGTAQVTAASQYGQAQGSQPWQYDPTPPDMHFTLDPATPNGANGWFVTLPTLTVQGSDATSGIAALRISPDGGATWHPSPWAVPEGQFNLLMQAVDGAGNITQAQTQVRVDVTPPEVQTAVPPPDGAEGWHLTPVTVQVSGQDATSGVAAAQVSIDGGAWQNDAATLSTDGIHTVRFLVRDAAGNTASAGPVTVKVDVSPPQTAWGTAWQAPLGCAGVLGGQEDDGAGSGVAGAALSWDDGRTWHPLTLDAHGRWQITLDPRSLTDGAHRARLRVWDVAGHQAEAVQGFTVAPPAPHIVAAPLGTDARWNFWETLRYEVRTTCLPIAKMRIVVEGPHANRTVTWDTHTWPSPAADGSSPAVYAVTWRWDTRWDDGAYAHPGEYPVRFEAWDAWGRQWMEYGTLVVPVMSGPTPTLAPLPAATATPTAGPATPTATALAAGFVLPTARPTPTQGPTPTAWLRPATATPLPAAAPVARHIGLTGHAPPWAKTVAVGVLFAGIVAALAAAYYRRKLAAWRARLSAYLAAKRQAEAEATAPSPEPYQPPPGTPEAALLEGDLIVPGKTPRVVHEPPTQHTAPPWDHGAGAYQPHVERPPWLDDQAFDAEAGSIGERNSSQPWWRQLKQQFQQGVYDFVMHHPFSWLSISYTASTDDDSFLHNYTNARWITYQPLAQNFLQTITYQRIKIEPVVESTTTINPKGWLDFDFGDGTLTFKGESFEFFIQFGALSFGWQKSSPAQIINGEKVQSIALTAVDVDLVGKNWASLKISHASGTSVHTTTMVDGAVIEQTTSTQLKATMEVYRWGRILVGAGVIYFAFEIGAVEAIIAGGGLAVEYITNLLKQIPVLLPGG